MRMDKLWALNSVNAREVLVLGDTTTFVGTDGHAATAEIRPAPFFNIRSHIMDLSKALTNTYKWLQSSKRTKNIWIQAVPYSGGETYGGHIHCSFMYVSPVHSKLRTLGVRWTTGAGEYAFDRELNPEQILEVQYLTDMGTIDLFGPQVFMNVMNYLIRPWEHYVQPWDLRVARNKHYGNNDDIRAQNSKPQSAQHYSLYKHYEYRVPSTWLIHPDLAYSYIGLAKLSMLNFEKIIAISAKESRADAEDEMSAFEIFMRRWTKLQEAGPVMTRDLLYLETAITNVRREKNIWFQPMKPIVIEEWSKYGA